MNISQIITLLVSLFGALLIFYPGIPIGMNIILLICSGISLQIITSVEFSPIIKICVLSVPIGLFYICISGTHNSFSNVVFLSLGLSSLINCVFLIYMKRMSNSKPKLKYKYPKKRITKKHISSFIRPDPRRKNVKLK